MPGRSIRVARIAGIPVRVSPLWLLIVALITWSLGANYYPEEIPGLEPAASYGLGLLSALLLFASILAHEFGHAIVARKRGVEIEEIELWLLGGVAKMSGRPATAGDEIRFALAGPAVTAVVSIVFGALALALPESAPATVRAVVAYQAEVNLLMLAFNLLPAFPLDGGRVARALMWLRGGDIGKATGRAAALGSAFGYLLVGCGVVLWLRGAPSGLWFVVVGFFLTAAAKAERVQEQAHEALAGVCARDLMSPTVTLPAALSLAEAQPCFARSGHDALPVLDFSGRVVGLLTSQQLQRESPSRWSATTAETVADKDPGLRVEEHEDLSRLLDRPAFRRVGRAAVVDAESRPLGIVSLTDLERFLRANARMKEGAVKEGTARHILRHTSEASLCTEASPTSAARG